MIDQNARNTAMWCHLSSLAWVASFLIAIPLPFASIIVPLMIWLFNRDQPFVDAHGKESLNFHLSLIAYVIAIWVILVILALWLLNSHSPEATGAGQVVLGLLLIAGCRFAGVIAAIFDVIVTIVAAFHANNGKFYRYPFTIRLLK